VQGIAFLKAYARNPEARFAILAGIFLGCIQNADEICSKHGKNVGTLAV
jgi:hypothetical protein